ncbi:hypothetical protein D070_13455 [Bacillus velezensis]|uniref:hypothetical protein n=1 Tax=Bacillus velezensis TaxID=492670 RepID=UPI001125F8A6|nr:hypothetical protein [Bacillus velezensis]QDF49578.1 hypothetical protein FIM06_2516 [Bacillus velezensis]QDF53224.1 hypothetical protein D069_2515 [Bacillus velezensis]
MAKLDGVKALDMVNGEITKVAYGGAEYVKTEGEAKVGDIVLITTNDWTDAREGEFYKAVGVDSDGDAKIKDDRGTIDSHFRRNYDLLRKVSAETKPSLEDRLSTLESDVAELKGESKTEYVRIDTSEARAGDYVKFIETADTDITTGKMYEIDKAGGGGPVHFTDDVGDENIAASFEIFEVYRKVSAANVESEPKPERLKVGEYAKVVNATDYHCFTDGDIVEIIGDHVGSPNNEPARRLADGKGQYVPKRELVRATDEEVAEAKDEAARAKFKKGAKVRLVSGGGKRPLRGFEDGKIYEVTNNSYDHPDGKRIRIVGSFLVTQGFATPDQLEILSEEEAAEIERKQAEEAKWAEIGRKVGEYRVGDIIAYDDPTWFENSGIGEIIGFGREGSPKVAAVDYEGCEEEYILKAERLNLITPVEARFDR